MRIAITTLTGGRSGGTAPRFEQRGEPLLGRFDLVAGVLERVPVDLARLPIHVRPHHRAHPGRIERFHITTLGVGAGVSLPTQRPEHFELVEHGGARGPAGSLPEREPEVSERVEEHRLEGDVALLAPLLEVREPPLEDSEPPLGIGDVREMRRQYARTNSARSATLRNISALGFEIGSVSPRSE